MLSLLQCSNLYFYFSKQQYQMSKNDEATDKARFQRTISRHSLENIVSGPRNRHRPLKETSVVEPMVKKNIPAKTKPPNLKKHQTMKAKREEKKRQKEQIKAKVQEEEESSQKISENQMEPEDKLQQKNSPIQEESKKEKIQSQPQQQDEAQEEEEEEMQAEEENQESVKEVRKLRGQEKGYRRTRFYDRREERRNRSGDEEKQYSLNRIFRKTKKIDFPSIMLEANLFTISTQNFVKEFGHFDIAHLSVPIEMLIKIPQLKNLIQKGFMFIWVERGEIQMGYHFLNRLGFDVIDQIMWVKTNEDLTDLQPKRQEGQLFSNCRSTCLIGYKCILGQKTQYCTKISNNLIFTSVPEHPLEKPEEIYQIGDLMMPGAKKIQIGYKQIGGWLTIRHHEQSLYRCSRCLKRNCSLLLMVENSKTIVKCESCNQKDENKKLKIRNICSKKQSIECNLCKSEEESQNGLIIIIDDSLREITLCKECFVKENEKYSEITQVDILYTIKYFFPSKNIHCTTCGKNNLKGFYFECGSCKKDHNLCNMCFWEHEDDHQWKFKSIFDQAQSKTNCFSCGQDCGIPYWGCQVCQNWFWCGRCNQIQNENHAHYQRKHELYLIV